MKLFAETSYIDFFKSKKENIQKEIITQSKEYILNVNEEEYKNYLKEKYYLEPLSIIADSEVMGEPMVLRGKTIPDTDVYTFFITYQYIGNPEIFKIRPSRYRNVYIDAQLNKNDNTVSYYFRQVGSNPTSFDNLKKRSYEEAFDNLVEANREAANWNLILDRIIKEYFNDQKEKYKTEDTFLETIKLKINKTTQTIFEVPAIKRKIIPQLIDNRKTKDLSDILSLDKKVYEDIINIINIVGQSMERKPSLYIGKDEEALRDIFLLFLETRYEAITATGETFNRSGKSDILLKNASDGSNLFVAECKIWRGASTFIDAINQLLERYLTWRDSKTALLMFVPNQHFTKIIDDVKKEVKIHQYYIKENGTHSETSLSYIFHLPNDNDKEIYLEIILFHFIN